MIEGSYFYDLEQNSRNEEQQHIPGMTGREAIALSQLRHISEFSDFGQGSLFGSWVACGKGNEPQGKISQARNNEFAGNMLSKMGGGIKMFEKKSKEARRAVSVNMASRAKSLLLNNSKQKEGGRIQEQMATPKQTQFNFPLQNKNQTNNNNINLERPTTAIQLPSSTSLRSRSIVKARENQIIQYQKSQRSTSGSIISFPEKTLISQQIPSCDAVVVVNPIVSQEKQPFSNLLGTTQPILKQQLQSPQNYPQQQQSHPIKYPVSGCNIAGAVQMPQSTNTFTEINDKNPLLYLVQKKRQSQRERTKLQCISSSLQQENFFPFPSTINNSLTPKAPATIQQIHSFRDSSAARASTPHQYRSSQGNNQYKIKQAHPINVTRDKSNERNSDLRRPPLSLLIKEDERKGDKTSRNQHQIDQKINKNSKDKIYIDMIQSIYQANSLNRNRLRARTLATEAVIKEEETYNFEGSKKNQKNEEQVEETTSQQLESSQQSNSTAECSKEGFVQENIKEAIETQDIKKDIELSPRQIQKPKYVPLQDKQSSSIQPQECTNSKLSFFEQVKAKIISSTTSSNFRSSKYSQAERCQVRKSANFTNNPQFNNYHHPSFIQSLSYTVDHTQFPQSLPSTIKHATINIHSNVLSDNIQEGQNTVPLMELRNCKIQQPKENTNSGGVVSYHKGEHERKNHVINPENNTLSIVEALQKRISREQSSLMANILRERSQLAIRNSSDNPVCKNSTGNHNSNEIPLSSIFNNQENQSPSLETFQYPISQKNDQIRLSITNSRPRTSQPEKRKDQLVHEDNVKQLDPSISSKVRNNAFRVPFNNLTHNNLNK